MPEGRGGWQLGSVPATQPTEMSAEGKVWEWEEGEEDEEEEWGWDWGGNDGWHWDWEEGWQGQSQGWDWKDEVKEEHRQPPLPPRPSRGGKGASSSTDPAGFAKSPSLESSNSNTGPVAKRGQGRPQGYL